MVCVHPPPHLLFKTVSHDSSRPTFSYVISYKYESHVKIVMDTLSVVGREVWPQSYYPKTLKNKWLVIGQSWRWRISVCEYWHSLAIEYGFDMAEWQDTGKEFHSLTVREKKQKLEMYIVSYRTFGFGVIISQSESSSLCLYCFHFIYIAMGIGVLDWRCIF